ncbi:hypothetical protein PAXRUDRAFT_19845 [Paxillus rubicundulus Ve08.2h10]|uniref:Retrotransposon Copia-like N-terminal domain-containing protein n=1 Tax=Paxillus rubicundulus Ve08.2h10 TaxID=930991 RepID=A0A0D0BSU1_9AGAM|nr:hypothetical protein PAXRUDRAFT_19845 [Paxillus rubicundulus Ve08.2h10]
MSDSLTPLSSSTQQANVASNVPQLSTHTMLTQHVNLGAISSYKMDPKLTDGNWLVWKTCMTSVLHLHGVFQYVLGSIPKLDSSLKEELATWEQHDLIAQTLIVTSIGDEQMIHTTGLEMLSEMWAILSSVHKQ